MPLRIEVKPTLASQTGLQARQVRDAHENPAARDEPAPHALQRRERLRQMLEHVPEDGCVERGLGEVDVVDTLAQDDEPRRGRHVTERLDCSDVVARARDRAGEPSVPGSEIEHAGASLEWPEEPQLFT